VAISVKRVKIEEKLLWGPIGSHQHYQMVPSETV